MDDYERIEVVIVPHDPRSKDAPFIRFNRWRRQRDGGYRVAATWTMPEKIHKLTFSVAAVEP